MQTRQQPDLVIDEIHAVRQRISERHGHDPSRLIAHYLELQQQYPQRLLAFTNTQQQKDPSAA